MFPPACSPLFPCFADREKGKVLTVVLKTNMTLDLTQKRKKLALRPTPLALTSYTFSTLKKKQADSKTFLVTVYCD